MEESRVSNSVKNIFAAWGGQAVYALATFIVRAVFVRFLSQEYVGLESLFTSLLTILTLADLGVGSAIVFALYEPLAKHDTELVKSLMRLFKRAYITIGLVIIGIGALIAPYVRVFVGADAPDIPNLEIYFFCFVVNTGVSYFFSYKGSLINADQKSYVVYLIQYSIMTVMCVGQIIVLVLTRDYLLYLFCMIASTVVQNVGIARMADKMYPYIREKDVKPLEKGLLTSIWKNVAGLMMHKVAGIASTPVNNLIITSFVGLSATSILGNYLLIEQALDRVLTKVFDSIIASVGNLGAKESEDRQYEVFQTTFFVNAVLYGAGAGAMMCAFNSFIAFWAGPDWRFPPYLVILICVLFYLRGMRAAGQAFTSAYGLYWLTKWKAVLEAVSLPVLGLLLVGPFGVAGVLCSSIISTLCISTMYEAWAIYTHGFHKPLRSYIVRFLQYTVPTIVVMVAATELCSLIALPYVASFVIQAIVGLLAPIAILFAMFGRTREAQEAVSIAKRVGSKLVGKLHRA